MFLLSKEETEKYIVSYMERRCKPTEFAKVNGAFTNQKNEDSSWWWLRDQGLSEYDIACVSSYGNVLKQGVTAVTEGGGIRPALWINFGIGIEE